MKVESYLEIPKRRFKIYLSGKVHDLSRREAEILYEGLHEALDKPPLLRYQECNDRYSHGPHAWGSDGLNYCGGRSFDVT
jgi:hypothetical protein